MDCEKKIMELSARTDLENLQSIIYQTRYQEVIRQQLEGILAALQSDSYSTVSDYLSRCYQDGYIGVMYDLHGQDIPLIMPIDQKAVVRAIQTDSKISKGLYNRLGEDVGKLKTSIRAEVSRGIAAGFTWNEVATKLAKSFKTTEFSKAYNNAMRIVRTEGHRIQVQSAMDAQQVAKEHGADIVKQWDATLDDRTRETHRMLDGQIRELDEPFEVGGMQADAPGMFGDPAEDCNCRCALLQRARWALDEDELNTLKERAEFFGLDKTKDFEEFKEKYLKAAEQHEDRKEKTIKNNVDAADILTQAETIEKAKKSSVRKEHSLQELERMEKESREYKELSLEEFRKMHHTVTKEERKILYGKTHFSGYINSSNARLLNGDLREGKPLKAEYQEIANTLSDVIQKNTISEDILVTRFVATDALEAITGCEYPKMLGLLASKSDIEAYWQEIEQIPSKITKRHLYEEKGFLSTSGVVDKNVMQEKSVRLNIKVPKEVKGYITTNYKESEIIFDRGTKIEILDAHVENNRTSKVKIVLDCIMR